MNKIKQLSLIIGLFLSCLKATAQDYNPEYSIFAGGLTAGANFTQIDGDSYKGYDNTGISAGGIIFLPFGEDMNLPLPGTIALSMEVTYNQKGSKGKANSAYGILSQTVDLKYAEVPILINWYRGTRSSIFGAGFAIGYLGSQEEMIDRGSGPKLQTEFPFRKFDFSFVLSPSIHIWNGFYINPRFQYSLLSIRKNDGGIGNSSQFNNVWSVKLMYLFKRGKRFYQ